MSDLPMTFEEALEIVRTIEAKCDRRERRALEVLERMATRGRRPSSMNLEAVGHASHSGQIFSKVTRELREVHSRIGSITEDLDVGVAEVIKTSRALRDNELDAMGRKPSDGFEPEP